MTGGQGACTGRGECSSEEADQKDKARGGYSLLSDSFKKKGDAAAKVLSLGNRLAKRDAHRKQQKDGKQKT